MNNEILKTVYFVRHGECTSNVIRGMYHDEDTLTERGLEQADFIAQRVKNIAFDVLIASPFTRAQQTAEKISKETGKSIETSALFREKKEPSEMKDLMESDEAYIKIRDEKYGHFHDLDWHYSDEENFIDLKTRAEKALQFLAEREEEKIVVVSHVAFIRTMVGSMIFKENFSSHHYHDMLFSFKMNNTGITKVILTNHRLLKNPHWVLVSWNDHAHLGEV